MFLQAPANNTSMISQVGLMLGIMVIFYVFMILPQMRRQKKERLFRENLKKGDKVVTIGGMIGEVVTLEDASLLLKVDENVKVRVEKAAVRPYNPAPAKA